MTARGAAQCMLIIVCIEVPPPGTVRPGTLEADKARPTASASSTNADPSRIALLHGNSFCAATSTVITAIHSSSA